MCRCLKILLLFIKIQISNSLYLYTNCILILLPLTVELHMPFVLIQKFYNSNYIILLHLVNKLQICPMTFHMLMIRRLLSMMMILPMMNFNQTTILHLVHKLPLYRKHQLFPPNSHTSTATEIYSNSKTLTDSPQGLDSKSSNHLPPTSYVQHITTHDPNRLKFLLIFKLILPSNPNPLQLQQFLCPLIL